MRSIGTYEHLRSLVNDINGLKASHPAWAAFEQHKIKAFFSENKMRLGTMEKGILDIAVKHVMQDAKGLLTTKGDDGVDRWQFENDEKKNAYEQEYKAFMKQNIDIFL